MIFASGLTRHRHLGMLLSLHVPRRNQSPPSLERQIVVAACAHVAEVIGRTARRRCSHAGAVVAHRAAAAAHPAVAALAAEELHGHGDDLGGLALLSFLVLPLAGLQATLDVDLAALVQVLAAILGRAAPHHDTVPLGP